MPMSIKQLLHEPEFQCLSIVAGENGLNRTISGINVIESTELVSFCRPNELLVTTGIHLEKDAQKLEQLVKQSYTKKAAGFIVNIGPYIPELSEDILQFANENNFPLFSMDWKYRVADLLKNTIEILSQNQTYFKEETEQSLLYNLIFRFEQPRLDIKKHLSDRGIYPGAELGIITCTTKHFKQSITSYKEIIYREFHRRYHHFLSFQHNNELIFLINRKEVKTTQIPFSKTVEKIYTEAKELNPDSPLIIGMGNFYTDLNQVGKSYSESLTVINLAKQHTNPFIQKYKELGTYKIIMNFPNQSVIEQFKQDMLGQLYFYDQLHNTDFVDFLKIFLEENGSTNKISKRLFIHRNTVAYKINKIESLLDIDLDSTFARTNLNVAFMIEDILNQRNA